MRWIRGETAWAKARRLMTTPTGIVNLVHGSRSESFKRLNAHHLAPRLVAGEVMAGPAEKVAVRAQEGARKRIRQNGAGLNKTEQAFFDWLRVNIGYSATIYPQAVTLKLGNGVRYTPDFFVRFPAGTLSAYEVKGFMRDDAIVKLKVAASTYKFIQFYLVTRRKGGGWDILEVLA
jgi:hypothetical protein